MIILQAFRALDYQLSHQMKPDGILGGYSHYSPHTATVTDGGDVPLGGLWRVKTQSAKICLNFNLGGGVVLEIQNPKCQDLPKFQFLGGGGSGKSKPNVPRSA